MNARKRRKPREDRSGESRGRAPEPILQGSFPRLACLAAFAALVVATPMLPGEAAAELGVGNPLAVGWLAVAALCLAVVAVQPEARIWWNGSLLCVVGLGVWMAAPTLVKWGQLHPRPAINMTFVYLGASACIFAGVQMLRESALRRQAIALLMILGTSLALMGLYQYVVTIPATARQYDEASQPQKRRVLEQYNLDSTKGSADRRHFEDRLDSTEPFATFGLANSLAGFLAPTLVLAFAAGAVEASRRRRASTLISLAFMIGLCGLCLLLTKSRTAYLAALVGGSIFVAVHFGGRLSLRKWMIASLSTVALIAVVATIVALAGGLDFKVLSESAKSFQYRIEYWQATAAMIADMPLLGCGPGQFQSVYPQYKLPQASETVADPHNFLLEVWATAGLPALLLLLAAIVLGVVAYVRQNKTAGGDESADSADSDAAERQSPFGEEENLAASVALNLGAGLGVVVALAAGAMTDHVPDGWAFLMLLVGFAIGVPLTWRTWELPRSAVVAALIAWGVHHLAAGGFGFPGVAIVCWVLAAVLLSDSRLNEWSPPTMIRLGMLAGAAVFVLLGMQYATRPLEAQHVINSVLMGNSMQDVRRLANEASGMDPMWVEPVTRLAGADHHRWLTSGSGSDLRSYQETEGRMIRLDPQTWLRRRQAGNWRLMAWRARGDDAQLETAIKHYQAALERYPNSLEMHAQLAWAHHLAGQHGEAKRLAELALVLNSKHPHREQKLDRFRLFDFSQGPGVLHTIQPPPAAEMAEQAMLMLRKSSGE